MAWTSLFRYVYLEHGKKNYSGDAVWFWKGLHDYHPAIECPNTLATLFFPKIRYIAELRQNWREREPRGKRSTFWASSSRIVYEDNENVLKHMLRWIVSPPVRNVLPGSPAMYIPDIHKYPYLAGPEGNFLAMASEGPGFRMSVMTLDHQIQGKRAIYPPWQRGEPYTESEGRIEFQDIDNSAGSFIRMMSDDEGPDGDQAEIEDMSKLFERVNKLVVAECWEGAEQLAVDLELTCGSFNVLSTWLKMVRTLSLVAVRC
jgi:hypothetical protein